MVNVVHRAPFVGRERELATLRGALHDACSGRPRIALVAGEPGIGKTRIAERFAAEAHRDGVRVLWGRCREGEGSAPLFVWTRLFHADFAHVFRIRSEPRALPPARMPDAGDERARLFQGVAAVLAEAAARQPLVLVLEDLHAADAMSLRLLAFVAGALPDARVLVLGTYRDTELTRGHPLVTLLGELAHGSATMRIRMGGLSEREVRWLIEVLAGARPAATVAAAIVEQSGGNPLFVCELVQLQRRGAPPTLPLPESVRHLIDRRLDALSPDCNRMLELASVLGAAFDARTLAALGEIPLDRFEKLLDEARDAGILVEHRRASGRYAFGHGLVRDVLYGELPTARRLLAHRRVGELLESREVARSGRQVTALAHHFLAAARAGPEGSLSRAIIHTRRAAELALSQLAYEEAAAHYEHALEVLELAGIGGGIERCELLLGLGNARAESGNVDAAAATFCEAADLALRLGAPRALARAALGPGGESLKLGRVERQLAALLQETLAALTDGDLRTRAHALARLAEVNPRPPK